MLDWIKKFRVGGEMERKHQGWLVSLHSVENKSVVIENIWRPFVNEATLFLEATSIDRQIYDFLKTHEKAEIRESRQVKPWPMPNIFYLPLEKEILGKLAGLCSERPIWRVCDHIHICLNNEMLMEGHEFGISGGDCDLVFSNRLAKNKIAEFSQSIGATMKRGTVPS